MSLAVLRSRALNGMQAPEVILPRANADEAALVKDATILPADSLLEVCAHFAAIDADARLMRHLPSTRLTRPDYPDFSDVKGQQQVKRALEVAAAGGHSVLMVGPPGTGKSMLAARFPGILPSMTDDEALESAAVQSLTSGFSIARWKVRPYRAPHHTASGVALVGGGSTPRPGEISLAHRGVLFLDEPEGSRLHCILFKQKNLIKHKLKRFLSKNHLNNTHSIYGNLLDVALTVSSPQFFRFNSQ